MSPIRVPPLPRPRSSPPLRLLEMDPAVTGAAMARHRLGDDFAGRRRDPTPDGRGPGSCDVIGRAFVAQPDVVAPLSRAARAEHRLPSRRRPPSVGASHSPGRLDDAASFPLVQVPSPKAFVDAQPDARLLLSAPVASGAPPPAETFWPALESDPAYYARSGRRPASELGVTPPSSLHRCLPGSGSRSPVGSPGCGTLVYAEERSRPGPRRPSGRRRRLGRGWAIINSEVHELTPMERWVTTTETLDEVWRFTSFREPPAVLSGISGWSIVAVATSRPQIRTTKTAEPTKANQNGAVTPNRWASSPAAKGRTKGPAHQNVAT